MNHDLSFISLVTGFPKLCAELDPNKGCYLSSSKKQDKYDKFFLSFLESFHRDAFDESLPSWKFVFSAFLSPNTSVTIPFCHLAIQEIVAELKE